MCSESALFSFQLLYVLHFFKYKVWKSFIFEDSVNYEKGFRVCSIVTGFACIRNAKKLTLPSVSNHVKHCSESVFMEKSFPIPISAEAL